jgi:hypothetical protein
VILGFILILLMLGEQGMAENDLASKPDANKKKIQADERQVDKVEVCEAYRADYDMYAVCRKRGLPTRRSSSGGFAYRPMDRDIAGSALPPECRGADGQPVWNGAPEVIEWQYCDNLNSGCEYYLFVQRFLSLDDLRFKDTLTARDKAQAFVQACHEETFGGSHKLAYVGTYPLMAQDFLDVLFGAQTAVRPKDAFGFDGMRRQGLALAPPPPFQLESFLLDTSPAPAVQKLNNVIREFERFRDSVIVESNELSNLEHAKSLNSTERLRLSELTQNRDVFFIKTFNELHAKGVVHDHKTSNASAADALKKALEVYPASDPQHERFQDLERRLYGAIREFDGAIDTAVKTMSHPRPVRELVYHVGDSLFLFLKGTGSPAPKLRMTMSIRQQTDPMESPVSTERALGILTRGFDDPPEINRQQNIVFAIDYQQYWVSFFTQPLLVADISSVPGTARGVLQNRVIFFEAPGAYLATVELFDETTQQSTKTEIKFFVVANRAASSR